jgi:hypothetical protein
MITNNFLYHFINLFKLFKIFCVVATRPTPLSAWLWCHFISMFFQKREHNGKEFVKSYFAGAKNIYIKIRFKK